MFARAQKLLDDHRFNHLLDRVLFIGGALFLVTSLVLATASLFAA
jgi:preprotein translocase subunit SecG